MVNSLKKVLTTAGIAPEKLTYQSLQALIENGMIQSAYSHVKNKAEFYMVRWNPFSDTQTWSEFQDLFKEGILSLEHDSLGELLQTANFYSESDTVEQELCIDIVENGDPRLAEENEKVYRDSLQALKKLKINPPKQQPFLAQSGVKMTTIVDFVGTWWHHGGHKTNRWNPEYAKPLRSDEFYDFIRKTKPEHWPAKLNQWVTKKTVRVTQSAWDEDTHLGTYSSGQKSLSFIFLPFDGWTLAECFRRMYKK